MFNSKSLETQVYTNKCIQKYYAYNIHLCQVLMYVNKQTNKQTHFVGKLA